MQANLIGLSLEIETDVAIHASMRAGLAGLVFGSVGGHHALNGFVDLVEDERAGC